MKLNLKTFDILLANKCLSVKELSKLSGVNVITLSKLKNGSNAMPKTIGKIAKALNVSAEKLTEVQEYIITKQLN